MQSRIHIIVYGGVQGVFFRANTEETASRLGVTGFVRNLPDGTVEVVAEGGKEKLEELLRWCSHGPPAASVSKIKHEWEENKNEFSGFDITY